MYFISIEELYRKNMKEKNVFFNGVLFELLVVFFQFKELAFTLFKFKLKYKFKLDVKLNLLILILSIFSF